MQGLDTSSRQHVRKALNQWTSRGYIAKMDTNNIAIGGDGDGDSAIFRKLKFRNAQ